MDAIKVNEMFVLSQSQVFELIQLNEKVYRNRPDNIFNFIEPLKLKQKEMNLDIVVNGKSAREYFLVTIGNFKPILDMLTN